MRYSASMNQSEDNSKGSFWTPWKRYSEGYFWEWFIERVLLKVVACAFIMFALDLSVLDTFLFLAGIVIFVILLHEEVLKD